MRFLLMFTILLYSTFSFAMFSSDEQATTQTSAERIARCQSALDAQLNQRLEGFVIELGPTLQRLSGIKTKYAAVIHHYLTIFLGSTLTLLPLDANQRTQVSITPLMFEPENLVETTLLPDEHDLVETEAKRVGTISFAFKQQSVNTGSLTIQLSHYREVVPGVLSQLDGNLKYLNRAPTGLLGIVTSPF